MADQREEAVRLLQAGELRQVQIARQLGVTEAAVSKWRKKLEEEGPDALELHKATGRPPRNKNCERGWIMTLKEVRTIQIYGI